MAATMTTDPFADFDVEAIQAEIEMIEGARAAEAADNTPFKGRYTSTVTGPQARFLARLIAERDTVGVGIPVDVTKISKPAAHDLIEALLKRPMKAGVEARGPKVDAASEAQINFINTLLAEKDTTTVPAGSSTATLIAKVASRTLTKAAASDLISTLKAMPRKALPAPTTAEALDGMYLKDGVVYKVQYNLSKTGVYAKRLVQDGHGEAHFEYAGSLRSNGLAPEHKMTLEQAKEYGSLYGTCCVCGRTLTDENSIAAGIGPICAGKGF